jgi:acetolactate synthase I/II/III large subunit
MMKLSDYVMQFLVDHGLQDIFLVSGGGIMHLLDSVVRQKDMRYYCNYHEQACAVCAEGYARTKNSVGVCMVTTGPGGVNALSGVAGAWADSIPMLVISGQVRRDIIADYTKTRQIGPQEGNVVGLAQIVTKYAKTVMEPETIRYELEYALAQATSGRPGPVWLDLPLDVQASQIDETQLKPYTPPAEAMTDEASLAHAVSEVVAILKKSRRPLMVGGNGVHLAHAEPELRQAIEQLQIPAVFPTSGKDLLPEDHPLNIGLFGTAGQRRANFALQNSDCLISLASGFSISKTGFNFRGFAPHAKKIMVDIDHGQLHDQVIKPDLAVQADVKAFLVELLKQAALETMAPSPKWLAACARWKQRYPIILDEYYQDRAHVNSYVFIDKLSDQLSGGDVLVAGNGLDTISYLQAFRVKPGQRTMTSINWGAMGWDLPLAAGACIANGKGRTICVTGDGSLQWNVHELLMIRHYHLPVKIFVFNNQGYSSIRATQTSLFDGRFVGADEASGIANPDFEKLAAAYGLDYALIGNNDEIEPGLRRVLASPGPVFCEVNISPEQGITPKASAFKRPDGTLESRPLEDMAPFLPREEIWENMHLFDADSSEATA